MNGNGWGIRSCVLRQGRVEGKHYGGLGYGQFFGKRQIQAVGRMAASVASPDSHRTGNQRCLSVGRRHYLGHQQLKVADGLSVLSIGKQTASMLLAENIE